MDIRSFFCNKQKINSISKSHVGNDYSKRIRVKVLKISNKGVNYLVTTNADVQDEITLRFIDSLVSRKELSDDEDAEEGICEEKESLRKILAACAKISDEIAQLTSSLNIRLAKL
jgi:hypothetical protein